MCDGKNDKLLILGLDGATWDILTPVVAKGWMPFLKKLKERGSYGKLQSTFPHFTAPAWVSFYTGMSPKNHGIFDWGIKGPDNRLNLINSSYITCTKLWNILNQNGKKVGVINLPTTYPPEPLDGVMVTGMFTPGTYANFTYPPELKKEIQSNFTDYTIDLKRAKYKNKAERIRKFVDDIIRMIRLRKELGSWLYKSKKLDVVILVFTELDRLQHCVFAELHDCLEGNDNTYEDLFRSVFRELDEAIRQLFYDINPDYFFMVSDHGFTRLAKKVYLNAWLRNQGYLTLYRKHKILTGLRTSLGKLGINKNNIERWFKSISTGRITGLEMPFSVLSQSINWSHTKAFMLSGFGIYLNVQDREKEGIVTAEQIPTLTKQLCKDLLSLKIDDKKVFSDVYLKQEYIGKENHNGIADILVKPNKGFVISSQLRSKLEAVAETPDWETGAHNDEGIFLGLGEKIKKDFAIEQMAIVDILPTVLFLMGLPLPRNFDGQIRKEIVQTQFLLQQTQVFGTYAPQRRREHKAWKNKSEEERIMERLEDLGYL